MREQLVVAFVPPEEQIAVVATRGATSATTRSSCYFMCCHPALSPSSQIALTLRAVGGLTTAEIARAFLVPEATMAQRLSRAKQTIRDAGGRSRCPTTGARARLDRVLHVLYLVFNEGYTATSGDDARARRSLERGDSRRRAARSLRARRRPR